MTLGSRLRALRRANDLTLGQLGDLLGVTPQAVHAWEKDKAVPRQELLDELAAVYGIDKDSLLEDNEPTAMGRRPMGMDGKLRSLRGEAGLTRAEVAERLGVTPQTVFNWENGKGEPRGDKLDEVTALYGVTRDYLLVDDPLDGLSWDERELLGAYRAADADGRLRLLATAKGLIEDPPPPES